MAVFVLVGTCWVAGSVAFAAQPKTFATAVQLRGAFALSSNAYERTLFDSFQRARAGCPGAATVPRTRRSIFEQEVDSTLRQLHDVAPFSRFATRVAALPIKPTPLAALAKLYLKEAAILKPLSTLSPATARERMTLICRLYVQWARHDRSIGWINGLSMRDYEAAHVPWNAAPRIAHAAIALVPALQRSGATYTQALDLTSVTLGFG
jgi:hypothetical protein